MGQAFTYGHILDSSESSIKSYMSQKGGIVKLDKYLADLGDIPAHKELIIALPESSIETEDVYITNFWLNKNDVCFQFTIWYKSNRFLNNIISQFDNPNVGFTRIGKDLKWEKTHLEINISNKSISEVENMLTNSGVNIRT